METYCISSRTRQTDSKVSSGQHAPSSALGKRTPKTRPPSYHSLNFCSKTGICLLTPEPGPAKLFTWMTSSTGRLGKKWQPCGVPLIDNSVCSSSARGLPDGGQNEVAEEYLKSFTDKWDAPTNQFVRKSTGLLRDFIHKTIYARCGKFSYGGLP